MALPIQEFKALHKFVDEIYDEADRLGWSYEMLARKAKLAVNTVYRLGNYDTMYPRAATVFQLARAAGFEIQLVRRKLKLRSA